MGDLHGVAGYEDDNGNMGDRLVIVVTKDGAESADGPVVETATQPDAAADDQDIQQDDQQDGNTDEAGRDEKKTSEGDTKTESEPGGDLPPDVDRHDDTLIEDNTEAEPAKPTGPSPSAGPDAACTCTSP